MSLDNYTSKVIVVCFFPHLRDPSGKGGLRSSHQLKEMLSRSWRVFVIVRDRDPLDQSHLDTSQYANCLSTGQLTIYKYRCPVPARHIAVRLWNEVVSFFSLSIVLFKLPIKADAVVSNFAPHHLFLGGWLYRLIATCRVSVCDIRDIQTAVASGRYGRLEKFLKLVALFEGRLLSSFDNLYAVSEEMCDAVETFYRSTKNVGVNYIGSEQVYPARFVKRIRSSSSPICLVISSLNSISNLGDFLDLVREDTAKKWHFAVYGSGECEVTYRKFVDRDDLSVELYGRRSRPEVLQALQSATVCYYPISRDSYASSMLGNKFFEYLGAGKPIIYLGPEGAVSKTIEKYGLGYVDTSERPSFSGALNFMNLVHSWTQAEKITFRDKCLSLSLEVFSAERSAQIFCDSISVAG